MADTKISDLVELGGASLDDLLVIVDVDDTSMATSGTNKKIKASNATGLLAPLAGGEISVTGATTATVSRMHVCSGTTADYTVTLPPASGNLGRLIGFRMAAGLTKLVTLDGNASETIDGALTRVLWALESAILLCDGSGWCKVAGKPRPMACTMRITASQTISASTVTKVILNGTDVDNTGLMADPTTNNRINVKRTGNYLCFGKCNYSGLPANVARLIPIVQSYSGGAVAGPGFSGEASGLAGGYPLAVAPGFLVLNATDYLQLETFHGHTSSLTLFGQATGGSTFLEVLEVPQW